MYQYYPDCLAHASYMIADEETKIAAVLTPHGGVNGDGWSCMRRDAESVVFAIPAAAGAGLFHAGPTDSCLMGIMSGKLPFNSVRSDKSETKNQERKGGLIS